MSRGIGYPGLGLGLPGIKRVFEFVLCLEIDLSGLLLEAEEFLCGPVVKVCSEPLPLGPSRPLVSFEL